MMQIREAQLAQFNYILVVGEDETSKKQVSHYRLLADFSYLIFVLHDFWWFWYSSAFMIVWFYTSVFLHQTCNMQVNIRTRDNIVHGTKSLPELLADFEKETAEFHWSDQLFSTVTQD